MLFSVIVPVYNVEAYLDECVESVVRQTFSDWEMLLVDDGSPDGCPAKCDAWAEKDSRIRVFHKENGGLSDARNYGINRAEGEWILFLDSDDWILEDALENFAACLRDDVDLVMGRLIKFYPDGKQIPENQSDIEKTYDTAAEHYAAMIECSGEPLWEACRWACRASFLRDSSLLFQKGLLAEDLRWTPGVILRARGMAVNGKPFYCYRQREGSIMAERSEKLIRDVIANAEFWFDESEKGVPELFRRVFLSRVMWNAFSYLPSAAALPKRESRREIQDLYSNLIDRVSRDMSLKVRLLSRMVRVFGITLTGKLIGAVKKE